MHPIKWIRQNQTKLMAVFVILIMIAFVMPTLLSQLAKPHLKGPERAMWLFDKDKKINLNDIRAASSELAAMRMLYIDKFLVSQQDLRFVLLGHLIFPEAVPPAALNDEIKNIVAQNRLRVSSARINDLFEQTRGRAELFWILLKAEAKNAGFTVPPQRAGEILGELIPKITNNRIDAQTLVRNAGQVNGMTDDGVLSTFTNILAIISYARAITDTEDVTEGQMANLAVRANETINAEFVDFSSETFIDKTSEPDEAEIAGQFEKYKNYYADTITEENPCGFGYKQKPRVALEYIIIKLEDVKKLVTPPTQEETEEYYQQNIARFTEQVPKDVNDPNSKFIKRQRSYAEVADIVRDFLFNGKAGTKAKNILDDVVEQAQAGFESLNFETAAAQQFKEKMTDYSAPAEKIAKQNNIKIYTGKTAPLAAEEMQQDRCLGSLMMQTQSKVPTSLTRLAFAAEQLGSEAAKLGPFDPPKPRIYVSFGPLIDSMGTIIAMVRVIEAENSAVLTDINFSYEKNLPAVFEDKQQKEKTFVLKDKVKQDCRKLAAFETARQKANEFAELAKNKGWDAAIEKFNSLYPSRLSPPKSAKDGSETPKTFKIQKWDQKTRVSQTDVEIAKIWAAQLPGIEHIINQRAIQAKLMDKFYSLLLPTKVRLEDANTPAVIEFQPLLSCYVIKSLSRIPVTTDEYEASRQQIAYKENFILAQSMTIEHFMPDNIIKRLNFRPVAAEPNEPNNPAKQNDANGAKL
ncbi:MAG: hypothetical protein WCE45_09220 [Sedimentisphaerales bacterium]